MLEATEPLSKSRLLSFGAVPVILKVTLPPSVIPAVLAELNNSTPPLTLAELFDDVPVAGLNKPYNILPPLLPAADHPLTGAVPIAGGVPIEPSATTTLPPELLVPLVTVKVTALSI